MGFVVFVSLSVILQKIPSLWYALSQTFSFLIFASMQYSSFWAMGDTDNNKVAYNHMTEDKLKGLKAGLLASIPYLLLYIALLLGKLGVIPNIIMYIYRFANASFMPILLKLLPNFPVVGLSPFRFLGVFALLLVLPLVCEFGYILGYKRISITEKIIYKNPRDTKRMKEKLR